MTLKLKGSVLIASVMGTILEYYDFALYSVFIHIFAKIFFPSNDPLTSFLFSLGAFAIGLITRPIGAILFGRIGDKYGRKPALSFAILLSAIPMLIIGCMPSYETIGIIAPCLIVIARMIQGISLGGEFNGAAIFVLEHLSKSDRRKFPGMISGVISSSAGVGFVIAIMMGMIVEHFNTIPWLWRLPFICGSLIGFVGFYIRYKTSETPEFTKIINSYKKMIPLFHIWKQYPKSCIFTFTLGACTGAFSFTVCIFFNHYISHHLGFPLETAMAYTLCCAISGIIACPLFGYICDYFDKRAYFIMATLGILMVIPIVFNLLETRSHLSMLCAQILFGLSYASIYGPQHSFIQGLFPTGTRYTGIAFYYCMGSSLLGGAIPMIMIHLIEETGNMNVPVFFLSLYALLLIITLVIIGPTKNHTLDVFNKIHSP